MYVKAHLLIVIKLLLEAVGFGPKVITLSNFQCIAKPQNISLIQFELLVGITDNRIKFILFDKSKIILSYPMSIEQKQRLNLIFGLHYWILNRKT